MYTDLGVVLAHVIPLAAKIRMRAAMVMVMDGIGTYSADFLTRLNLVLQAARKTPLRFGGITTFFAGDFLQLPPPNGSIAFTCAVWSRVFGRRAVLLSSNWRHVNEPMLLGLIVRLTVFAHMAADLKRLASRKVETPPANAACWCCGNHTIFLFYPPRYTIWDARDCGDDLCRGWQTLSRGAFFVVIGPASYNAGDAHHHYDRCTGRPFGWRVKNAGASGAGVVIHLPPCPEVDSFRGGS